MKNLITCMTVSLFCGAAFATTWTVDDDGKADFNNIQDAIDVAQNGDYIAVQDGLYFESIDFLGKDITVEGTTAEKVIIDGSKSTSSVVTFKNGETQQAMISRCTIQGGRGTFWVDPIFGQQRCGGGVYCEETSPTIAGCNIQENFAWGGGGIFATQGAPLIMYNNIVLNVAEGHGGGIYFNNHVNATIDSCEVQDNIASWGGGMTCTVRCDPTIVNSSFNANITNNVGGGIFIRSSSSPIVSWSEFKNNVQISNPLGSGGGVCIYGSGEGGGPCYPTFTQCDFEGNTVLGDGGGMSAAYDSHPQLTNCTFRNNAAGRSGGGLACVADPDYLYPSNAEVRNCLVELNHANEEGGGIHVRFSDPLFDSVDVYENTAINTGGGINFFESPSATLLESNICINSPNQIEGKFTDGGKNTICDSMCPYDIDGDGNVNVSDLLAIIDQWGLADSPADVNFDGIVDVSDLLIVVGNWGPCE